LLRKRAAAADNFPVPHDDRPPPNRRFGEVTVLRRHYLLPPEHGSWIWWIGPLLIGVAAAGAWTTDIAAFAAAAFAAFLLRQPVTILVKIRSGRRPSHDLRPALFWAVIASLTVALAAAALIRSGHARVLVLAVPGVLVFGWHLWLVSRREERGQLGVEVVGAGVLALTAPGAYWVCGGTSAGLPWLLWLLCWLQAAASIVLVYFRLGCRKLQAIPPLRERMRDGSRTLAYNGFNAVLASALALAAAIPELMASAFLLMLLDAIAAVARPPVGLPPTRIGVRQLLASSLFVVLCVIGFLTF
jgi:hypothetical protein